MIIVDNCILSSLSKIDHLELLKHFKDVRTTNGVIQEIFRSEMDEIISPVSSSLQKWLFLVSCNDYSCVHELQKNNIKLSFVDCELIIACKDNGAILFSDDTRLINAAEMEYNVKTFDLCDILCALKKRNRITPDGIEQIILKLKRKDHYSFKPPSLELLRS